MADRNKWDDATPANYREFKAYAYVVELYVYIFGKVARTLDEVEGLKRKIKSDFLQAHEVWGSLAGINLQVAHLDKVPGVLPVDPINFDVDDLAKLFPCDTNTTKFESTQEEKKLYDAIKSAFWDMQRTGDPDLTKAIAVYYLDGIRMKDDAVGCSLLRYQVAPDPHAKHIILITEQADASTIAHEIGHCLFSRYVDGKWIRTDPDPKGNGNHNKEPTNLMYPASPDIKKEDGKIVQPVISPEQAKLAKASPYVSGRHLPFGFIKNEPYKLAVEFGKMYVSKTSDETFDDEALESDWKFTARIRSSGGAIKSENSTRMEIRPLSADTMYNLDRQIEGLILFGNDQLEIEASGVDEDFLSPNDDIARMTQVHGDDGSWWGPAWGSKTVILGIRKPDGSYVDDIYDNGDENRSGVHIGEAENEEIKYRLKYYINTHYSPPHRIFRTLW